MSERIVYIDWLKIIAAVMVVMLHTAGMLCMNNPTGSFAFQLGGMLK